MERPGDLKWPLKTWNGWVLETSSWNGREPETLRLADRLRLPSQSSNGQESSQTAGRLGMAWRLGTARGLGTAGPGPGDLERPGDLDSERPGDLERPLETSNSRCIVVAFCDNNALFVTKRALQFLNCNALNLKIEAGRAFLWRRVKLRPPGSLSGSGSRAQPGLNFTLNLGVNSYH